MQPRHEEILLLLVAIRYSCDFKCHPHAFAADARKFYFYSCTRQKFLPKCDLSILVACFCNAREGNTSLKLDCVPTIVRCHYVCTRLVLRKCIDVLTFSLCSFGNLRFIVQMFNGVSFDILSFLFLHFRAPMMQGDFVTSRLYVEFHFSLKFNNDDTTWCVADVARMWNEKEKSMRIRKIGTFQALKVPPSLSLFVYTHHFFIKSSNQSMIKRSHSLSLSF